MTGVLRLDAPAKLNLELRVVGRRDDGLHLLDGHFVLLDLADRLLLMPGCSGLRVDGALDAAIPLDGSNLAWQGLLAGLEDEPELACLALEKHIPAQAGLGGGSSDAAAAWRLGRTWRSASTVATAPDLASLARIGADVPFFAAQVAAARVTGIGERIEPVAAHEVEVILVRPPFGLSTAEVFAELLPEEWGLASNDLLAPALRLRPELASVIERVAAAGGEPHLTGSGPTVFALTDDPERAAAVAARLSEDGMDVTMTRTRTGPAMIEAFDDEENA